MKLQLKSIILFLILFGLCFVDEEPKSLTGSSCILCGQKNFLMATTAEAKEKEKEPTKELSYVTAYYFHGNYRCSNCKKIEQYSREAIENYFKEQLKTKRLVFNIINIDLPENKHYVEDYQLYTRSLIIAEFKDGKQVKWENLTKVWDYLNDRDKFYKYVQSEIQKYLGNI